MDHTDSVSYGDNRGARLLLKMTALRERNCSDGLDDDHDGRVDCADADCGASPQCRHPDFDRDDDVDQEDFGHLQACFTPDYPATVLPGCDDANLDGDSHVNQDDMRIFLACMSAPGMPTPPGCGR